MLAEAELQVAIAAHAARLRNQSSTNLADVLADAA
jgi:hypothetical protein